VRRRRARREREELRRRRDASCLYGFEKSAIASASALGSFNGDVGGGSGTDIEEREERG